MDALLVDAMHPLEEGPLFCVRAFNQEDMLALVDALPLLVDSLSNCATNVVRHGVPHVKSPALCDPSHMDSVCFLYFHFHLSLRIY